MTVKSDEASHDIAQASIESLHRWMDSGETTSLGVVETCLRRIDQWDRAGPKLASILALNPAARELAAAHDSMPRDRTRGLLHGIPVVVKDNCGTVDMPTTGACLALRGNMSKADSTVVRKLKEAGAIILGKSNLHDLALSGTTVSSLGGQTLNPYDLGRTPGGSSGGSGAAVTMGFAVVGIGTDTVNSIRSPSSANCIVGLRPTKGLVSRAGIIPVSSTQDAVGPMARTVSDVARTLEALAGYDPADPATARCLGKIPNSYTACLDAAGLKGKRLGFLRCLQGNGPGHQEVNGAVDASMQAMREAGADVVSIEEAFVDADDLIENFDVQKWEFKRLFDAYLHTQPAPPVHSLRELMASGGYHRETVHDFLVQANDISDPDRNIDYLARLAAIDRLRDRVLGLMARHRLDAMAYPLQRCLVVPVGRPTQEQRNGILASLIGFPALTVPMGFSRRTSAAPIGVPMGLDILARPFEEPLLIALGYAFEQATNVRRPPVQSHWSQSEGRRG